MNDIEIFKDKEEAWRAARKVEREHDTRATVMGVWGKNDAGQLVRVGYVIVTDEYHLEG